MKYAKNISVIGGDTRNIFIAKRLSEYGYNVSVFGFENHDGDFPPPFSADLASAMHSDAVILPLPCSKDGKTLNAPFAEKDIKLKEIAELTESGTVILHGMGDDSFTGKLRAKGAKVFDYYKNEDLIVKNALLTSEGILGIIIENLPVTVWRLKAAVTGYGRVSYFISRALKSLGADVTVYARDISQLAKAETAGYTPENIAMLPEQSYVYDVIINTVPSRVADKNTVMNSRRDCLFIEAASAPYGIDFEACKKHGRTLIKAFSQPGKTAPKTAGIIIADAAEQVLKEVFDDETS